MTVLTEMLGEMTTFDMLSGSKVGDVGESNKTLSTEFELYLNFGHINQCALERSNSRRTEHVKV